MFISGTISIVLGRMLLVAKNENDMDDDGQAVRSLVLQSSLVYIALCIVLHTRLIVFDMLFSIIVQAREIKKRQN